jgi:hypothetical protein
MMTAIFQITDSLAYPRSAIYLLTVHPSLHARLTVAPLVEHRTGCPLSFADLPEVTINGGCAEQYPAIVFSARRVISETPGMRASGTNGAVLSLIGLGFERVRSIVLQRQSHENMLEALEILSQCDTSLKAQLPLDLGEERATILLTLTDGATSATTLLPEPMTVVSTSPPFLICRVADPGQAPKFGFDPRTGTCSFLYLDPDSSRYRYAYRPWGGEWERETVPDDVPASLGDNNPLAFDSQGVVYTAGGSSCLSEGWRLPGMNGSWSSESAGCYGIIHGVSGDVDTTTNLPAIAYTTPVGSPPEEVLSVARRNAARP